MSGGGSFACRARLIAIGARKHIEPAEYDMTLLSRDTLDCVDYAQEPHFEACPLKADMADPGHYLNVTRYFS